LNPDRLVVAGEPIGPKPIFAKLARAATLSAPAASLSS
jgi:hypothetical protein